MTHDKQENLTNKKNWFVAMTHADKRENLVHWHNSRQPTGKSSLSPRASFKDSGCALDQKWFEKKDFLNRKSIEILLIKKEIHWNLNSLKFYFLKKKSIQNSTFEKGNPLKICFLKRRSIKMLFPKKKFMTGRFWFRYYSALISDFYKRNLYTNRAALSAKYPITSEFLHDWLIWDKEVWVRDRAITNVWVSSQSSLEPRYLMRPMYCWWRGTPRYKLCTW